MSTDDLSGEDKKQAIKAYVFWTAVVIVGGYLVLVVFPQLF